MIVKKYEDLCLYCPNGNHCYGVGSKQNVAKMNLEECCRQVRWCISPGMHKLIERAPTFYGSERRHTVTSSQNQPLSSSSSVSNSSKTSKGVARQFLSLHTASQGRIKTWDKDLRILYFGPRMQSCRQTLMMITDMETYLHYTTIQTTRNAAV
jgi:hypothetical protein